VQLHTLFNTSWPLIPPILLQVTLVISTLTCCRTFLKIPLTISQLLQSTVLANLPNRMMFQSRRMLPLLHQLDLLKAPRLTLQSRSTGLVSLDTPIKFIINCKAPPSGPKPLTWAMLRLTCRTALFLTPHTIFKSPLTKTTVSLLRLPRSL